uniref:Uncharacterized protein n=1 Tax=Arcella intermedia TaxID=1963864 RepID=A0A6B2LLI5_9EUKA
MGSGGVGKSAITLQFINRQFLSLYDPTIEDRYQKHLEYKGIQCMLEILDTAGQETFSAMRELYMANGEGFALIYSITSTLSFQEVEKIRSGIIKHKNDDNVPIVLVGNKKDLEAKREVALNKGKETAKEWGCDFLESSAKTDTNVREIFYSLIDQIWEKTGGPPKQKKTRNCIVL